MIFYFAGGAMEVGGSCVYVRISGHGILIDSGIRQGGSRDPLPDFRGIQELGGVDAILVSHAHMDHTGTLPVISSAYPDAKIYMTAMTADLTRVLLYDSLKLMDKKEEELPQYSENEVRAMFGRIIPLSYQKTVSIFENMELTMYPAGHIAGAACLYLTTPEGSLFYSGDVSGFAQQTIEGIAIPRLRPDVAILESTYGDRLHAVRSLEEQRLVNVLKDCVERNAKVLIPVFALGRSQEVLLVIRKAILNKEIPEVPVYVDGMVRDMNRVYTMHPAYLKRALCRRILKGEEPFYTEEIVPVSAGTNREELMEKPGPAVFLSSSGMLSGGPSVQYAKRILSMENGCVILTGYQDEESPGRALLNLLEETEDRSVYLDGIRVPVKARIEMVGLSAHADSSELVGMIEKMTPRNIILVHGNEEAITALGALLATDYRRRIFQPSDGETLEIQLRKKRDQIPRTLAFSLNKETFRGETDAKYLWTKWKQFYQEKAFSLEDTAYFWFGKRELEEKELKEFQTALLESIYFDRHLKRMHLIRPCLEEEIEEAKKKAEFSVQDVEAVIREILQDTSVRKIGYYPDQKRAVLTVDFPDSFSKEILEQNGRSLHEKTGWSLELKSSVNHQAVNLLLTGLFGTRIEKLSYFENLKQYRIDLKDFEASDVEKQDEFFEKTGWKLDIRGLSENREALSTAKHASVSCPEPGKSISADPYLFLPDPNSEMTDQNLGMSLIHACFADKSHKPYKISIKNDMYGRYMELLFLTPAQGLQEAETIKEAARQTGWQLRIAKSVNQNQLIAIAGELCARYRLAQQKNPSYMPATGEICLRLQPGQEIPEEMLREFKERTGAVLK